MISETENLFACSIVEARPFPLPIQTLTACSFRGIKNSILGLKLSHVQDRTQIANIGQVHAFRFLFFRMYIHLQAEY